MTDDEAIKYAVEADRLLNNKIFSDAVSKVRSRIHDKWEHTPVGDFDAQYVLRTQIESLNDVTSAIKLAISEGKIASKKTKTSVTSFFRSARD